MNTTPRPTSIPLVLFLTITLIYGFFYNGGSWGQNARYNVIYSFVEPGPDQFSFRINRFLPQPERNINTGDWSLYDGQYYSNKAPGTSLIGIPVYLAVYWLQRLAGADMNNPYLQMANAYLLNLLISTVIVAAALTVFYRFLLVLELTIGSSLLLTAMLAFSTMLFPYSTQLWGHPTAAGLLICAVYTIVIGTPRSMLLGGLASGAAVLTDFLAGPIVLLLTCWCMGKHRKTAAWFIAGGVPLAALGAAYNYICFGSPLALPTDYTNPEFIDEGHALGLFGALNGTALWQLTFGKMRGLFAAMPLLLGTPLGLLIWLRREPRSGLAWCCLAAIVTTLFANASFNGWHGGATVCARYQIVALPFWIIPLKELLPRKRLRIGLFTLAMLSCVNMLVVAAVSPIAPDITPSAAMAPQPNPNPLFGWAYGMFAAGDLAVFKFPLRLQLLDPAFPKYIRDTTWNIGMLFGLTGLWSLLPLAMVVPGLGWWLYSLVPGTSTLPFLHCYRNAAIALLFSTIAVERGRFVNNLQLLQSLFHPSSKTLEERPTLQRAFPHYELLTKAREKILAASGPIAIRLQHQGDKAVLQRVAEILYPIRIDPSAKYQLRLEEREGVLSIAFEEVK